MKTYSILFLTILFISGCSTTNSTNTNSQMEESYISDFKMQYFRKTLKAAFHNSEAINNVLAMDHSVYGEPILSADDYSFLDSLAIAENQKMTQDSVNRIGKVSEGAQGKRVFDYVLQRMNSKWLDSIAKERSKPFVKQQKEYN